MKNRNTCFDTLKYAGMLCALCIAMTLFHSCTRIDTCLDPKVVALRGGFYLKDTGDTYRDTLQQNANVYFGKPATFFSNMKNVSKFVIPLSQTEDSITLYFQADSLISGPGAFDTLGLRYNRELHFISTACGYETFFNDLRVGYSRHFIDTVLVSTPSVSNDVNKEHIRIVLQP